MPTAEKFELVRCECGEVLLEALFEGIARTKCHGCRQRVWIVSTGKKTIVGLVDSAPERVVPSTQ